MTNDCQSSSIAEAVGDDVDIEAAVPAQFSICDANTANWLVRKIVECRAYADRCQAWAERERQRAVSHEQFFLARYGSQLMDYTREHMGLQSGRKKSISLPAGVVGFRSQSSKLVVDDESAVLDWARKSQPDLIVVTERLSKTALNEHFESTGELPDAGVHVEPARESFYIK